MTITPTVFTWPTAVVAVDQLFYVGGEASEGLFTVGGVMDKSPEPGGRAFLDCGFNYMKDDQTGRIVSWLMSKVTNGNVFRMPITRSLQIATPPGVSIATEVAGLPWDLSIPWDEGFRWAYEPVVAADGAVLAGNGEIDIDVGDLGTLLQIGHVIGPASGGAHLIDDISYAGSIATMKLTPPLRRDVADGAVFTLRPEMFCTVDNPDSFRAMFQYGKFVKPGNITFIEAII